MIKYPTFVLDNLKRGDRRKNFRVNFLDDKIDRDLINSDIVADSVTFTESLSSDDNIKFGVCESSSLEFTALINRDVTGSTIKAGLDIEVNRDEDLIEYNYTYYNKYKFEDPYDPIKTIRVTSSNYSSMSFRISPKEGETIPISFGYIERTESGKYKVKKFFYEISKDKTFSLTDPVDYDKGVGKVGMLIELNTYYEDLTIPVKFTGKMKIPKLFGPYSKYYPTLVEIGDKYERYESENSIIFPERSLEDTYNGSVYFTNTSNFGGVGAHYVLVTSHVPSSYFDNFRINIAEISDRESQDWLLEDLDGDELVYDLQYKTYLTKSDVKITEFNEPDIPSYTIIEFDWTPMHGDHLKPIFEFENVGRSTYLFWEDDETFKGIENIPRVVDHDDLDYETCYIPYGVFKIGSCRKDQNGFRQIQAYTPGLPENDDLKLPSWEKAKRGLPCKKSDYVYYAEKYIYSCIPYMNCYLDEPRKQIKGTVLADSFTIQLDRSAGGSYNVDVCIYYKDFLFCGKNRTDRYKEYPDVVIKNTITKGVNELTNDLYGISKNGEADYKKVEDSIKSDIYKIFDGIVDGFAIKRALTRAKLEEKLGTITRCEIINSDGKTISYFEDCSYDSCRYIDPNISMDKSEFPYYCMRVKCPFKVEVTYIGKHISGGVYEPYEEKTYTMSKGEDDVYMWECKTYALLNKDIKIKRKRVKCNKDGAYPKRFDLHNWTLPHIWFTSQTKKKTKSSSGATSDEKEINEVSWEPRDMIQSLMEINGYFGKVNRDTGLNDFISKGVGSYQGRFEADNTEYLYIGDPYLTEPEGENTYVGSNPVEPDVDFQPTESSDYFFGYDEIMGLSYEEFDRKPYRIVEAKWEKEDTTSSTSTTDDPECDVVKVNTDVILGRFYDSFEHDKVARLRVKEVYSDAESMIYDVSDNYFIQHSTDGEADNEPNEDIAGVCVENIAKALYGGMMYRPLELQAFAAPFIEPGDWITVDSPDGQLKTIVLKHSIKGVQNLISTISSK